MYTSDMVGREQFESTDPDGLSLDGERTSADQPSLPVHDGERKGNGLG